MNRNGNYVLLMLTAVALIGFSGCEPKSSVKVELAKSLDTIKAEAANMDAEELRALALKFKNAILAQREKIDSIMKNMQSSRSTEKIKTEALGLGQDIDSLMKAIGDLKNRYDVYINQLKSKNADVTGLSLSE